MIGVCFLASCGLFDNPKPADTKPKVNTFPDYQHISGNVKGTWTKANNPHVITDMAGILAGDTLVIGPGVQVEGSWDIYVNGGSTLFIEGTADEPVLLGTRPKLHSSLGGGSVIVIGTGKLSHVISQRAFVFSQSDTAASLEIDHGTFLHDRNDFLFLRPATQVTRVSIRHSIFAMPVDYDGSNSPVALTTKDGVADTALWTVDSNCFFRPGYEVGQFWPAFSLTTLQGGFSAAAWPGNGNLAADPMFVDYKPYYQDWARYLRSDSVLITTVYDLHLKSASPCKGMGAYEK